MLQTPSMLTALCIIWCRSYYVAGTPLQSLSLVLLAHLLHQALVPVPEECGRGPNPHGSCPLHAMQLGRGISICRVHLAQAQPEGHVAWRGDAGDPYHQLGLAQHTRPAACIGQLLVLALASGACRRVGPCACYAVAQALPGEQPAPSPGTGASWYVWQCCMLRTQAWDSSFAASMGAAPVHSLKPRGKAGPDERRLGHDDLCPCIHLQGHGPGSQQAGRCSLGCMDQITCRAGVCPAVTAGGEFKATINGDLKNHDQGYACPYGCTCEPQRQDTALFAQMGWPHAEPGPQR